MIISRTPLRISFVGGGTDLPEFYREHGGSVLSVAINKYLYLSLHPYFFGEKYFLKYSKSEQVNHVDEIEHKIIKEVFKEFHINEVDFNSSADIPSGTGLGSSSAFTAGLINLCCAYNGKYMSKSDIAEYSCRIEIDHLKSPIGKQDQYACAVGGMNAFYFNQDDSVLIDRVFLSNERLKYLSKNIIIFYSGFTRSANSILSEQKAKTQKCARSVEALKAMAAMTDSLKYELTNGDIDLMGEILHEGWMLKKSLVSTISNSNIDDIYNEGLKHGAIGGKLLGAGGSGFVLFYVKEFHQEKVREAMTRMGLKELEFEFDFIGTSIIYS